MYRKYPVSVLISIHHDIRIIIVLIITLVFGLMSEVGCADIIEIIWKLFGFLVNILLRQQSKYWFHNYIDSLIPH